MTFVDNHKVEEVLCKKLGKAGNRLLAAFVILALLVAGELLVEREENFVRSNRYRIVLRKVDLVYRLFERRKILLDRLVHQIVPVGKIEHFLPESAFYQTMDDLKGGVGLAGSCGHDEQKALLPSCYSFDRSVYGVALVVARAISVRTEVIRFGDDFLLVLGDALPVVGLSLPAGRKFLDRRKGIKRQRAFKPCKQVMLLKGVAI